MKITAAVTRTAEPFAIEELELEAPLADELVARIAGVGLCHTDLAARDQLLPIPLPVVLGHEGAGIVEQASDGVTGLAPGDHVVLSFASCGACGNCHEHMPGYCESFMPLNFGGVRANGTQALSSGSEPAITTETGEGG